jgi:ABC-type sugar transport system substrate-binding protein
MWSRGRAGCVVVAASLLLAACGGNSGSGGSDTAAGSNDGRSSSVDLAALKSQLAEFSKEPTEIPVSDPIPNPPRNKTLAIIEVNSSSSHEVASATEEAANLFGWEVTRIPTEATPAGVGRSWDQAVQLKPDVLIASAFPPEVYQKQLDELRAGGTKIVGHSLGTDAPTPGYDYETRSNGALAEWVKLQAWEIAVDADGKPAKVASFWATSFAAQVGMKKAFVDELARVCPNCEVEAVDVDATDVGTEFPAQAVSYLQRNPDTGYIAVGFTALLTGVGQAVERAGVGENLQQVLGLSGDAKALDAITPDSFQTWDLGSPTGVLGYQVFDAALRLEAGMPTTPGVPKYESTLVVVTPDNVEEFRKDAYVFIPDYQEQFKKLWGVS